jgi:hypothetical protein
MIKNNGKVLVRRSKICKSDWSKAAGLMFSKKDDELGLIFMFDKEKRIPLHMLFVFYPIDVLFLDSKKKVVEIKRNFKSFTFYNPKKKCKYFIEVVEGKAKGVKVGDTISFKN